MNSRSFSILWGILLIAAGGLFLIDNLGLLPAVPPLLWAMVFGGASALFCAGYLVSGIRAWGWLFPAAITAAIAATIFLSWLGIGGAFIATMFLWAIGLPFWVGFALDYPRGWPFAIPGYALFAIGGLVLLAGRIPGELFVALVLLAIALPFAVAFLMDREKWWALIPAGAMAAVAVLVVLGRALAMLWPLALLVAGGWLVLTAWRRRATPAHEPPAGRPDGDRAMVPPDPEAGAAAKAAARWTGETPVQVAPGQ